MEGQLFGGKFLEQQAPQTEEEGVAGGEDDEEGWGDREWGSGGAAGCPVAELGDRLCQVGEQKAIGGVVGEIAEVAGTAN
jgi:hypothetical protein